MKTIAEILAANIVARRNAMGLTQQALADRAGVDISTIAKWETKLTWPRLTEIQNIATILKVDPVALYQEDGVKVSPTPREALAVLQELVAAAQPSKTAPKLTPIQGQLLAAVRGLDESKARQWLAAIQLDSSTPVEGSANLQSGDDFNRPKKGSHRSR